MFIVVRLLEEMPRYLPVIIISALVLISVKVIGLEDEETNE